MVSIHNETLFGHYFHRNKWFYFYECNMNRTGDDYVKSDKSDIENQISHDLTHMGELKM